MVPATDIIHPSSFSSVLVTALRHLEGRDEPEHFDMDDLDTVAELMEMLEARKLLNLVDFVSC